MTPIRVTHVIPTLDTGGAELMLFRLLRRSDPQRVAHRVICLRPGGSVGDRIEQELDLPVAFLEMRGRLPGLRTAARLWEEVRRGRPQVLLGWMYHGNLAAWGGRRIAGIAPGPGRPGVPLAWNIHHSIHSLRHDKPLTVALIRLGRMLSRRVDRIVYVSVTSARQHEALGYAPDRTRVIPNGFDVERFAPSPEARRRWRSRLDVPDDALLVGLVARLHPVKDHATFLRAAAAVAETHPAARFVLAGREVSAASEELANLIGDLGIGSRVHLLGEVRDTPGLDAALDVACSSSASEAFPIVVGEAMAAGVPCVVTDVGDSAELVGETGRVVPRGDPRRFAEAVSELLSLPAPEREALGLAARARIVERYSLASVVERYTRLFEELVGP